MAPADDDETSTWVVARDGGQPRKLSDQERRSAPPVSGHWDKAHRRVLFVDRRRHRDARFGDGHAAPDHAHDRRRSEPALGPSRVGHHLQRDNNLFLVPLEGGEIAQLTDVQPHKRDPRETDSQKFIKAEEQKLIEHTRVEAEKKKKAEDKDKANALPKFELADRQSATDLQLSPDDQHVFILIVERAEAAKRPNVPNYVTESSYTEDIPARTFVGDAQDTPLARGDESGHRQDGDGRGSAHCQEAAATKDPKDGKPALRWAMAALADDGGLAVAHVRAANNKERWLVAVDPESGTVRVLDALHDEAWVREVGGFGAVDPSYGLLPDQKQIWFLSERDGWMHLYTVDATASQPTARQLTQGRWEIDGVALSADQKKFYITSTEADPGERHIYAMPIAGGERTQADDRWSAAAAAKRRQTTARSVCLFLRAPSRPRCT